MCLSKVNEFDFQNNTEKIKLYQSGVIAREQKSFLVSLM